MGERFPKKRNRNHYIKDTALSICNNCSQKIIGRCHTCHLPMYKGDLVCEISIIRGAEYFVSASEEEKKVQCNGCYLDGLEEQDKKRLTKIICLGILIFLVIGLLFIVLPIFQPKLTENWSKTIGYNRMLLVVLIIVIPILTIYLVNQEFSSRYRTKKEIPKVFVKKRKKYNNK